VDVEPLIYGITSQQIYFFSNFTGRFMEIRIWKVERTPEEILDLKTRPLQIVFDEEGGWKGNFEFDKKKKRSQG
jgi:hypothetical protein